MKKIIYLTLALLTYANITTLSAETIPSIEGTWGKKFDINGIELDMIFQIEKDRTVLTNICTGFGKSTGVSIIVNSSYSSNTYTIHENKVAEKNDGINCDVSAQAGTLKYKINGNQLIFTQTGNPENMILERR